MIRKILFTITISLMMLGALQVIDRTPVRAAFEAPIVPQTSTPRFGFTEISLSGTSKVPFMRVSWAPAGFKTGEIRIEGYTLTVELSGNGETGKVVQTPSANVISVSVGLLGIPNEQRIRLFGGSSSISATVTLKVSFIQNGLRKEVTERSSTSFRPLSNPSSVQPAPVGQKPISVTQPPIKPTPTPTPKPTPERKLPDELRERLKNPEGRIPTPILERPRDPRPTPTPTPPFPLEQDLRVSIKDILPVGLAGNPASVLVSWGVEQRFGVKLEGYELSLELIGDGVSERLTQTADPKSKSLAISLAGLSADKRARIFNSRTSGRINAILKAKFTARGQSKTEQAQRSRILTPSNSKS